MKVQWLKQAGYGGIMIWYTNQIYRLRVLILLYNIH